MQKQSSARVRAVVAGIVGVAIIVGAMLWYGIYHRSDSVILKEAYTHAASATATGNYSRAYSYLKDSEAHAYRNAQKVTLYGELAAAAANVGTLNEAIDYYTMRHTLDSSTVLPDAELLADLYERVGSVSLAIEQYQLAREYVSGQPPSLAREARIATYDEIVRRLEQHP